MVPIEKPLPTPGEKPLPTPPSFTPPHQNNAPALVAQPPPRPVKSEHITAAFVEGNSPQIPTNHQHPQLQPAQAQQQAPQFLPSYQAHNAASSPPITSIYLHS